MIPAFIKHTRWRLFITLAAGVQHAFEGLRARGGMGAAESKERMLQRALHALWKARACSPKEIKRERTIKDLATALALCGSHRQNQKHTQIAPNNRHHER